MIRFIGDVHGKYSRYRKLIRNVPRSIQVGDMGIGFRRHAAKDDYGTYRANPPHDSMSKGDHRWIRGNHDNPAACTRNSHWIADGTFDPVDSIMFVGGGKSIDIHQRLEGFSYWSDEELTYAQFMPIIDQYVVDRPRIMVTHDCPDSIIPYFTNRSKQDIPSITRQALQVMMEIHQPKLWIFGHWHTSLDITVNGTRFVCLGELEYLDIEPANV